MSELRTTAAKIPISLSVNSAAFGTLPQALCRLGGWSKDEALVAVLAPMARWVHRDGAQMCMHVNLMTERSDP